MKRLILIKSLMITVLMTSIINCFAQQSAEVKSTMDQIVRKHEKNEGVSCMTVAKGSGLEMVKLMFNKEFGKEFMKGVTSITVIDYSDASEQTCTSLRKDLDAFLVLLQEFDISKEKEFADNDYLRCFALTSDEETLSDFVIAIEKDKSRMVMYMAGKIKFE